MGSLYTLGRIISYRIFFNFYSPQRMNSRPNQGVKPQLIAVAKLFFFRKVVMWDYLQELFRHTAWFVESSEWP